MCVSRFHLKCAYIVFIEFCCVLLTNSRSSTLWRLNADETKIVEAKTANGHLYQGTNESRHVLEDDLIFNIISSTVHYGESWIKGDAKYQCAHCHKLPNNVDQNKNQTTNHTKPTVMEDSNESLDCGKPVNFTYYDNLVGVQNRYKHPVVPEPQVALIFTKGKRYNMKNIAEFDVAALERRLKKAKREKPKSVQLYNQIGNFWRIKGHAGKAIECFRRALAVTPHNSDVLLNLARVLFTLQYLDDAIYLTRRSLEVQPPDKGAWQQYFTLGEIFRAYGHYQEAIKNLRHSLELKPGFEPAQMALKEMEAMPNATIHIYTLVIIICLVLGVLLVILSSMDSIVENEFPEVKPQRHFNKAMAMRSLRGLTLTHKTSRLKRL